MGFALERGRRRLYARVMADGRGEVTMGADGIVRIVNPPGYRLGVDEINYFIAEQRPQRTLAARDYHAVLGRRIRSRAGGDLLLHLREGFLEVERRAVRRSQPANRVAAFFDHLTHQLQRSVQDRLHRGIVREAVGGNVNLHRTA